MSDDPAHRLVVVGCSRRKLATARPVPALDLYQGGCVPALRRRLAGRPESRERVRILSAEHGLLTADTPLLPYDRALTRQRAHELAPRVAADLRDDFDEHGWPTELLAVLEPHYFSLLYDVLTEPGHPLVRWVLDPVGGWAKAARVLDAWGWT